MESNTELTGKLATKSNVNTEYNVWNNEVYKTAHNYEVYSPSTLDTSGNKKYALFLEVYAGPEFQKISETFKRSWPQIHLPAAYDCITVSVDGRGSAFQGDRFMFSNYRALGQTERVDQTGKPKQKLQLVLKFGKIRLCQMVYDRRSICVHY